MALTYCEVFGYAIEAELVDKFKLKEMKDPGWIWEEM